MMHRLRWFFVNYMDVVIAILAGLMLLWLMVGTSLE